MFHAMATILRFFVCSILLLISIEARTQESWDISGGVGSGSSSSGRLSAINGRLSTNFILSNQLTLSGFIQAHIDLKFDFLRTSEGSTEITLLGGMVGYALPIGETSRFNFRGGLAAAHIVTHPGGNTVSRTSPCFVLSPRLELPIFRAFGLGLGGYANIVDAETSYGFCLDLMFGKLWD